MMSGEGDKNWEAILQQAEKVIDCVDQAQLLTWLGMKADMRDDAADVKKDMEKNKQHLVEALAVKGEAMIECGKTDRDSLLAVYTEVVKYVDLSDSKVFTFTWKLFKQLELYGKALKIVVKHHEDKRTKETEKIVVEILKCLGWDHVVRFLEYGRPAKFPADYKLF